MVDSHVSFHSPLIFPTLAVTTFSPGGNIKNNSLLDFQKRILKRPHIPNSFPSYPIGEKERIIFDR
jgi:hypothetical protein